MDVLEQTLVFCEQTEAAINAAHDENWELSQAIINDRDKLIKEKLSMDFSLLETEIQEKLRTNLETLNKLNSELIKLALTSKNEVMTQKSTLVKNKEKINTYLDNALK